MGKLLVNSSGFVSQPSVPSVLGSAAVAQKHPRTTHSLRSVAGFQQDCTEAGVGPTWLLDHTWPTCDFKRENWENRVSSEISERAVECSKHPSSALMETWGFLYFHETKKAARWVYKGGPDFNSFDATSIDCPSSEMRGHSRQWGAGERGGVSSPSLTPALPQNCCFLGCGVLTICRSLDQFSGS